MYKPINEEKWRLDLDLFKEDALLDPITFDDLILAAHCGLREITPQSIANELKNILDSRIEDMTFLLQNNIDLIIKKAMEGREKA